MDRQAHSGDREIIVAKAIENVVAELRMVDVADYVAYIKLERFANISDLVASAAELYFMPGTLRLGHGGEARRPERRRGSLARGSTLGSRSARPQGHLRVTCRRFRVTIPASSSRRHPGARLHSSFT